MKYSKYVNDVGRNLTSLEKNVHDEDFDEIRRKLKIIVELQTDEGIKIIGQNIVDLYRKRLLKKMKQEKQT